MAGTLRRANADAFVYLIPPLAGRDGRALLMRPRGDLDQLTLPGLADEGPLDSYDAAYQEASNSGWDDSLDWHHALEVLCDWAWTAAFGPLLNHIERWQLSRLPRLVIIPVGRLSLVPWHAARTTGPDGQAHYAVQDAIFCYAASAGQFARAAARPPQPATAHVLVANPTGDLKLAESEVAELKRRYYPGAAYLGRPDELATGPATSTEILSRLPGGAERLASLLHCGCHANVAPSLAESYLLLSGDQQLRIADILSQAQRRDPASPGFLAVLSACMTDLANTDHGPPSPTRAPAWGAATHLDAAKAVKTPHRRHACPRAPKHAHGTAPDARAAVTHGARRGLVVAGLGLILRHCQAGRQRASSLLDFLANIAAWAAESDRAQFRCRGRWPRH